MADGFLGQIGDILTGGLQTALDLEIAERLGELNGPSAPSEPRGSTDSGIRTDDGRVIRAGEPSGFVHQLAVVPPLVWAAIAGGVVLLFAALRR